MGKTVPVTQEALEGLGILGLQVLVETKVPAQLPEDKRAELLCQAGCKLSGRHTANEKLRLGGREWLQPQQYLPAGLSLERQRSVCGEGPKDSE